VDSIFIGCAKFCVLLLALLVLACLVRAVRGPRIADRIVACNMIGTMTICIIAILGTVMEQSWLYDICLIYAMISFLAVVVLSRIYTGAYRASQKQKQEQAVQQAREEQTAQQAEQSADPADLVVPAVQPAEVAKTASKVQSKPQSKTQPKGAVSHD